MSEYKVVHGRAYNAATKLFVKDSYPCHYVATFKDGSVVACYGGDARIISAEIITFAECFPDFKHLIDIKCNTAAAFIYNNRVYYLPNKSIALFANDVDIIAETASDYYLVEKIQGNGLLPNNTILHNIRNGGYLGDLNLMIFNADGVHLYASSQIEFIGDRCRPHDYVQEIYFNNCEHFYVVLREGDDYKLVDPYDDSITIELKPEINGVVTNKGKIQYVCKYTDCAVQTENAYTYILTLPGSQTSVKFEFRGEKNFADELIYVCGSKYFSFNKNTHNIIIAQN